MADEEIIKSVRLTPEEARLLDEKQISFTDLVKETIDKRQKEEKINTKKQTTNKLIANGVYTIIGLAILSTLNMASNLFTIAIIGGLGAFFTLIGGIQLYLTIKELNIDGQFKRK